MCRHFIFLISLIFIGAFQEVYGDPIAIPVSERFSVNIEREQLSYLKVSENQPLQDLIDQEVKFTSVEGSAQFDRHSVYWIKLKLDKTSDSFQRVYFYTNKNDFAEVFLLDRKQVVQSFKAGYLFKESEKLVKNSSYYGFLEFEETGVYDVYIKLKSGIHHHNLGFKLKSESSFIDELSAGYAIAYGFLGILLIMTIYAFLVFFNFRDKAYLYYATYIFLIGLFYLLADGVLREYFFCENPEASYIFITLVILAPLFYYLFLQEFLEISDLLPEWDRVFYWLRISHVVLFLITVGLFFVIEDLRIISMIARGVVIIDCIIGLVLNFLLSKKQHKLIKYFVYGSLILLVSALIDAIRWDMGEFDGILTRIGLIGEILFFSLGLGKKMKLVEMAKRNVQFQLMNQLRSNKESAEKRQAELQRQVAIRTKELQEQAEMLEKARDEAENASLAKSEFLSIMSHEIRTPMNGVIGMTHLLLQEEPKPDQVENLKTLKFSAENLLTLLNDILDYNKIESGMISLEATDFSLTQLIRGLGYQFKPRAASKGINFNISVDTQIPEWLKGDPSRLNQILMNLISNAVKFTNKGEVGLRIDAAKEDKENLWLTFEVCDTGIGIPEDKLPIIFDRFTQASTQTSRQFGGTGLGLAITKRLLELMSSRIVLDSTIGEGSKFYFTLKLSRGVEQKNATKESTLEMMMKSVRGTKALIVDDNKMNRIILEKFLTKWGMNYDSVEDGIKALEIMKTHDYGIILLDIQMPHMDGFEVARRIRAMKGMDSHNMPVIALSADVFANVYNKLIESGMDDFVSKPLDPNELLEVIYKYTMRITV